MRGTLAGSSGDDEPRGIIPAYAGNTAHQGGNIMRLEDHPRVCGEHSCTDDALVGKAGSSPRMRGTPKSGSIDAPAAGIIPAYAGNTAWFDAGGARQGDHPRVCGEHLAETIRAILQQGSSPRMRGTRGERIRQSHGLGIIPAYAGNTYFLRRWHCPPWDHPRVCGEHGSVNEVLDGAKGSSPRMRGTPNESRQPADHAGIIPAYAGNTVKHIVKHAHLVDHPRVCGEHLSIDDFVRLSEGSSPRMRGTLDERR